MKVLALTLLFALVPMVGEAGLRVRHVEVKRDQIVVVRTALGVATIIQVPDKPNSVVVGDQAGFKIEYLDQAVTIKPLHSGAKSNLYIYTDWRRFNAQLVTGSEAEADYVVYLENARIAPEGSREAEKNLTKKESLGMKWTPYRRRMRSDELSFEVRRLGQSSDGLLVIEFAITSSKPVSVQPEWIWLTQAKAARPIQGLFLSTAELKMGASAQALIQVLRSDINENETIYVEVRRKKTSVLSIPKVASWK
ncbi:MAG TPA: hypothetical protein DCS07_11845 [Bdellovibrionales bacterium]|nr:MAG: hypothetical protein A2Z97_03545 [Bdellovibrionales bacterium GWB1_52_6]OFZ04030.1 MAG: hypothetical protein A2X97_14600 [Bdellovibrionales bacterium GWA1_52_35]OFZ35235.1 MAG: hypothetical protein A2070_04920 [Bdellovibrionales bacterium GWC1_52_8]HAR43301.1 hypothetical protein [Bdellovibrionales bacterium]HCM39885.1 hypothetical protein [Bdellovibrionales bacterium]